MNFDASGSTDPDAGDILTYAWDLDGDGQYDDSTAVKPSRTYNVAQNVTVRLKVTDKGGLVSTDTVLIGAGIATALSIWAVPRVGFDYNVLNLQAKGTESVAWERRILAGTGRSGSNGLSSSSSLEELRRKQSAFEKLRSVADVDSVLRVIPDDQAEKIAVIKSFAPLVAPIRVGRSSPVELERLKKALYDIRRRFDVVAAEAGSKLPADVRERRFWDQYQEAYEEMLNATSTEVAPWYVIPADKKWFARACVADIITSRIEKLDLKYPKLSDKEYAALDDAKRDLENE